jgi:hypothetical protein
MRAHTKKENDDITVTNLLPTGIQMSSDAKPLEETIIGLKQVSLAQDAGDENEEGDEEPAPEGPQTAGQSSKLISLGMRFVYF